MNATHARDPLETRVYRATVANLPETGDYVYVHHAADGRVLYVGRTSDLYTRTLHHRNTKPWWPDVVRIEAHRYSDWVRARVGERHMIHELAPIWNREVSCPPGTWPWIPDKEASPFLDACVLLPDRKIIPAITEARRLYANGWSFGSIGQATGVGVKFGRDITQGLMLQRWPWNMTDIDIQPWLEWKASNKIRRGHGRRTGA